MNTVLFKFILKVNSIQINNAYSNNRRLSTNWNSGSKYVLEKTTDTLKWINNRTNKDIIHWICCSDPKCLEKIPPHWGACRRARRTIPTKSQKKRKIGARNYRTWAWDVCRGEWNDGDEDDIKGGGQWNEAWVTVWAHGLRCMRKRDYNGLLMQRWWYEVMVDTWNLRK